MSELRQASTMHWHHKFGIAGLALSALWFAACSATPPVMTVYDASASAKISPVLLHAAQQLQRGDSLPANGPVRSDARGRIQVYVHVSDTSTAAVTVLAGHGLQDTVVSPEMHIVQGWLSASDLVKLAALPFVTYITPPNYAKPR
ncbi:MAG: hypothetical protein KGL00_09550 [Gammaproteobacteria bacterium]|nr:hypothetical protein [Gammaproteobacteria bacterium]MDE2274427.1 hypothetical protein [Gammaproteobacteria bacterium]